MIKSQYENQLENAIVTLENSLARAHTKWSVREVKLLFTALSLIKTRDEECIVKINKRDIIEKIEMNPSDISKLKSLFLDVRRKTEIVLDGGPKGKKWSISSLLRYIDADEQTIYVQFEERYIPLLDELEKNFTWFYLDNIAHLKSKHAISLFKYLRSYYDREKVTSDKYIPIDKLKEIFELDKNAYMVKRKDKNTGKESIVFDIYKFELRVLNKAIEEINEKQEYTCMKVEAKKVKSNGKKGYVKGYMFEFALYNKKGELKTSSYNKY